MTRGTIEPRPGGRFRAKVSIAGRIVQCGTHATREEAQRAIDAALAVAADVGASPVPTVGELAATWLERRELRGTVRGVHQEQSVVRAHILGTVLATLPVDAVLPRDVRAWLEDVTGKQATRARRGSKPVALGRPVSRQTVRHALRVLRGIFARAVRDEHIPTSPADFDAREDLPSAARESDAWTFLTPAEIEAVTTSPRLPLADRRLYAVAIYTGLRAGELWGLRWGDVVLDGPRPQLSVRRSRAAATKAGKPREVPLLDGAREVLSGLYAAACAALPAGETLPVDALVFPSATGGIRRPGDDNGWRDKPQRYRGRVVVHPGDKSKAGISRPVRFHDLRHTCASALVSGTWGRPWRLEEVAAFLGHSSIEVTKRYAHLSPDALHGAAAATRGTGAAVPAAGRDLRIVRRAMEDSNLRPTAPEAGSDASAGAEFGAEGTAAGQARDVLVRFARGERIAHPTMALVTLAEAVLAEAEERDAAKAARGEVRS